MSESEAVRSQRSPSFPVLFLEPGNVDTRCGKLKYSQYSLEFPEYVLSPSSESEDV